VTLIEKNEKLGLVSSYQNNCQYNFSKCESWVNYKTINNLIKSKLYTNSLITLNIKKAFLF
jgi:hypothetical protein